MLHLANFDPLTALCELDYDCLQERMRSHQIRNPERDTVVSTPRLFYKRRDVCKDMPSSLQKERNNYDMSCPFSDTLLEHFLRTRKGVLQKCMFNDIERTPLPYSSRNVPNGTVCISMSAAMCQNYESSFHTVLSLINERVLFYHTGAKKSIRKHSYERIPQTEDSCKIKEAGPCPPSRKYRQMIVIQGIYFFLVVFFLVVFVVPHFLPHAILIPPFIVNVVSSWIVRVSLTHLVHLVRLSGFAQQALPGL
jgi:hypothetical protein